MIITGGYPPNLEAGRGAKLSTPAEADQHRIVTKAVHAADPDVKIVMQILHTGPLAARPTAWPPRRSARASAAYVPNELDEAGIEKQLADFANCAALAKQAGYDGVEIIGSAGYLCRPSWSNRPTSAPTAGAARSRTGCASRSKIVRRVRAAVGPDFILIFRISAMDMLRGWPGLGRGRHAGQGARGAGVNIVCTHFCWHEAQVPTIATMVPSAAFTQVTGRLRKILNVPMITSQPHQHAERRRRGAGTRRRRPGLHGPPDAGRPGPGGEGAPGPRGRDQHLHRLQPGLP